MSCMCRVPSLFALRDLLCGCHGLSVQSDPLLQRWRNSWMDLLVSLVEATQRNRMELFESWLWGCTMGKVWGENLLCVQEKVRKRPKKKEAPGGISAPFAPFWKDESERNFHFASAEACVYRAACFSTEVFCFLNSVIYYFYLYWVALHRLTLKTFPAT